MDINFLEDLEFETHLEEVYGKYILFVNDKLSSDKIDMMQKVLLHLLPDEFRVHKFPAVNDEMDKFLYVPEFYNFPIEKIFLAFRGVLRTVDEHGEIHNQSESQLNAFFFHILRVVQSVRENEELSTLLRNL